MNQRTYVTPGTRLALTLSPRERDLILERAFLDPEIETRLRAATANGSRLAFPLALDDIDDFHGCVAAEANHCDDVKVRRVLEAVCDRLGMLETQYTDKQPKEAVPAVTVPKFTQRQGQYLAFIYYFTKLHGQPPAEADMQRFFKVSPPSVHAMIVALEKRGLVSRTPGRARSVTLRVSRAQLPELE